MSLMNVPGGGNLISEVLRLTLNDLETRGELPHEDPVLYLQVDNCGENKNKTGEESKQTNHSAKDICMTHMLQT